MKNKFDNYPQLKRRNNYKTKSSGEYYTYRTYKTEISEDSQERCVYCDIHADYLGGVESMQLDHFRPQKLFSNLKNDPHNLVLSCIRCNSLKNDDWNEDCISNEITFIDDVGYIDPFLVDRNEYFKITFEGEVTSNKAPAKYVIERLNLNREFLKRHRQVREYLRDILLTLEDSLELQTEEYISDSEDNHRNIKIEKMLEIIQQMLYQ